MLGGSQGRPTRRKHIARSVHMASVSSTGEVADPAASAMALSRSKPWANLFGLQGVSEVLIMCLSAWWEATLFLDTTVDEYEVTTWCEQCLVRHGLCEELIEAGYFLRKLAMDPESPAMARLESASAFGRDICGFRSLCKQTAFVRVCLHCPWTWVPLDSRLGGNSRRMSFAIDSSEFKSFLMSANWAPVCSAWGATAPPCLPEDSLIWDLDSLPPDEDSNSNCVDSDGLTEDDDAP